MIITSLDDVDRHLATVAMAAEALRVALRAGDPDPLRWLHGVKFSPLGRHPIEERSLNAIEQVNQTWTYITALKAARWLLGRHPDAGGFRMAPGAHADQALDVMSLEPNLVGAETFAAVTPSNNGKLLKDLAKLAARPERHRYVFFIAPTHPATARQPQLERHSVEVWSLHAD